MTDKYYYLIEKRYAEFKHVLEHCGCFLLESSEDDIEYHIFEEFDIGVRTYMHEDMLGLFVDNGFSDKDMEGKCEMLRTFFVDIQPNYSELWNVLAIKSHPKWRVILELSDEIKKMLYV